MRVLFADQFSDPGGAQMMLMDIIDEARRRGWHCEFIAPGSGKLFDLCRSRGIPAHRLSLRSYGSGAKTFRDVLRYVSDMLGARSAIRNVISGSKIDLVIANGPRILPATVGLSCPVVVHLHSRPGKKYARTIANWALRRNHAQVICCSRFVAEPLRNPVRIVYNGVMDCGYEEPHIRNRAVRIGILGRIAPDKGHMDFVRAADIVARARPDVRFRIHGASLFSDASFENDLRSMASGGNVEFHGWSDDIAGVLHDIDILLVPSAPVEATPRVIMEAFSAGTPVIAYPVGGIPELIRHEDTGLLTDRADSQSLANAIERLLSEPDLMMSLARNARAEWEHRFRLDRFQRDMCDLLERSAEERRKPQAAAAVAGENNLV